MHQAIRREEIDGRKFPTMTSKVYRIPMGKLGLVLWPGVIAAYGD
jgi:hypothetical protein